MLGGCSLRRQYGFHHRDEHPLPNLFYCVSNHEDAHDLLVGCHILHLIRKHGIRSATGLVRALGSLGYAPEKVGEALGYLRSKDLFQWRSESKKDEFVILPEMPDAFWGLMALPSYVDNIAMTAPVEKSRLTKMQETEACDNSQFLSRVETTAEFLRQVRSDERDLQNYDLSRTKLKMEDYKEALYKLQIPSIYKLIADVYVARLRALQTSEKYLLELTPGEWASVLRQDVFSISLAQASETLFPS